MAFYFKLLWPFCLSEQNRFSYFGKGSPKQHSYEVCMKFAQGCRKSWRLKFFSIFSSGSHLVFWSGMILAILIGSRLVNILVKSESN